MVALTITVHPGNPEIENAENRKIAARRLYA
jgi:hypothetical protein